MPRRSYEIQEDKARKIFETADVYTWVDKQVLEKGGMNFPLQRFERQWYSNSQSK